MPHFCGSFVRFFAHAQARASPARRTKFMRRLTRPAFRKIRSVFPAPHLTPEIFRLKSDRRQEAEMVRGSCLSYRNTGRRLNLKFAPGNAHPSWPAPIDPAQFKPPLVSQKSTNPGANTKTKFNSKKRKFNSNVKNSK
ncbi:hypothetical protein MmiAt1_07620 [Methanimicrococcus sp. At1]|uniref:Uncharacterized protein n=1 Tax=Methanimicrococcus hacksteinii TaxID=3028293 RepID=A0ABU3VPG6_9EURY|nr:hypothetical protein [Methanimicrococcus sp. At1]MDV0445205.1 hypothetical protein [Methanimicrococcus sp. At1]